MFTFNEIMDIGLNWAYLNPGRAVLLCIITMLIINFGFYLFKNFDNY